MLVSQHVCKSGVTKCLAESLVSRFIGSSIDIQNTQLSERKNCLQAYALIKQL